MKKKCCYGQKNFGSICSSLSPFPAHLLHTTNINPFENKLWEICFYKEVYSFVHLSRHYAWLCFCLYLYIYCVVVCGYTTHSLENTTSCLLVIETGPEECYNIDHKVSGICVSSCLTFPYVDIGSSSSLNLAFVPTTFFETTQHSCRIRFLSLPTSSVFFCSAERKATLQGQNK